MTYRTPSDCSVDTWQQLRVDPIREELLANGETPELDRILELFPRTTGPAAFDAQVIAANIERLETNPEVDTGHALLDLSVKTGLAFIDATFQGDHPKYGIMAYGQNCHNGFPPVIISSIDALSGWGLHDRAKQLFRYWLLNLVREDGTVKYRGTSIAEMGQLIHTGVSLAERSGTRGWWGEGFPVLDRMVQYLLQLRARAESEDGLIAGSPEDDERKKVGKYFHNNAWAAKGLVRWAELCRQEDASPTTAPEAVLEIADALASDSMDAIQRTWPDDPEDWWLPPQVEPLGSPIALAYTPETGLTKPDGIQRIASYTNYRYWPELLSSGLLPEDMANRVVEARLHAGGQFCGMTRFANWLDDWPLADYLYGLWQLGRKNDFLLSLFGHVAYHQAEDHLTAYEQVTFPPGAMKAPYCLPCQLVAARAARLLVD